MLKTQAKTEYLLIGGTIISFLFYKWMGAGFRIGDGNLYAYMGDAVTRGLVPYRDFLFADPPILPYVLAFANSVTGSTTFALLFFPSLLEAATALLLWAILKTWQNPLRALMPLVYLSSLVILRTSDHFQGSQLTVFFSVLGVFFWTTHRPTWSGLSWALACLTKLYMAPAAAGFFLAILLTQKRAIVWKWTLGAILTGLILLGPFLVLHHDVLFQNILFFPLQKTEYFSKTIALLLFLRDSWPLILLALISIPVIQRPLLTLPLLALFLFFLLYRDVYYLYFANFPWYFALLSLSLIGPWWRKQKNKRWAAGGGIFLFLSSVVSLFVYHQEFRNQDRFTAAPSVAAYIRTLPDPFPLYGEYEVTPLLALLSGRSIYQNHIDSHGQRFVTRILNRDKISAQAATDGIYLILRTHILPSRKVAITGFEDFFDPNVFTSSCLHQRSFYTSDPSSQDAVSIYRCKK